MILPQIELIAPAGSFETLDAVFSHGADAAYIGIESYNLRAHAPSFTLSQALEAVRIAHESGKKIYAVLNTMPNDQQMEGIEILVKSIAGSGQTFDAVVVSDPGVLSLCREFLDRTPLHLSTQTGTFNSRSMAFWRDQGISRIILPRELTLDQIRDLNSRGTCETEVFIHGAMCVSISGRCLLGAYVSGRHPNMGDCPQPCRNKYRIMRKDESAPDAHDQFDVEESESGTYLLNSKDLNTIEILDRIVASGVSAVKIEGRNKSVHYLAAVVKVYRAALNAACDSPDTYKAMPLWQEELDRIDHRPYTTGFYAGDFQLQETSVSKASARARIVGVVKGVLKDNCALIDVKNPFFPGDTLSVLPVKAGADAFDISCVALADMNGNPLDRAPVNSFCAFTGSTKLRTGDMLRVSIA